MACLTTGLPVRTGLNKPERQKMSCQKNTEIIEITFPEEHIMKMEEIRNIAKAHHIKAAHVSKRDLIRSIQSEEGNFDCFGTAYNGVCDQANCLWRDDCFDAAREVVLS